MKLVFKVMLVLILAVALVRPVTATEKPKVVLGQIGLSFYAVVGGVVQEVLGKLGHPVEIVQGSHAEIFPKLGNGEVDILAAAWLPGAHGPLHAPVADRTVEVATIYTDAKLYWAVPDYVPANVVSAIDDLKKPDVLAKMDKRIVGIGPDSGLMRGAVKINQDYGLDALGYTIVTGPAPDWIANFRKAVDEKRWVVMPLWQPHFLNRAYRVRILAEPKGIYGTDRAVLLARKDAWEKFPANTRAVLSRISLGLDAVTEMDYAVNVDKKSPRDAAREWLQKNPQRVNAWFGS
ncbi:MAG: glycine betaine ABC transporter substrate-binding protein [Pseudomonadota bacterium]